MFMTDVSRIRLGVLTRPHGLQGGLRCTLDYPGTPVISTPCEVAVGYSESFTRSYELTRYEPGRGEIICFFRGVDDRDKAMELADQALFVPAAAVSYGTRTGDPGLIGFQVFDEENRLLGSIEGIFQTAAHYVWTIVDETGREWMLPAVDEFVLGFDEENRRIDVRLIPGLYDDDQEVARDAD